MAKTIARMNAKLGMDSRQFSAGADDATVRSRALGKSFEGAGRKAAALNGGLSAIGFALPGVGGAVGALGLASGATGASWGALNKEMSPGVKKLAGITAGAIGLAIAMKTVGAAARAAYRQFGEIDRIAKLSHQTGMATDAIVGWGLAADKAGTDSEKLAKGQQQLSRRIGEAANGYGEGARGLKTLGLEAAELVDLAPEEQFKRVADAIAAQENPALKAAAAYGVFGKSGQDLINVLNLGSAGLNDAARKAQYLGLTFDDIDAWQIENANDAVTELKASMTGFARTLATDAAPATEAFADRLTEIVVLAREGAEFVLSGFEVKSNTGAISEAYSRAAALAAQNAEVERLIELEKVAARVIESSTSKSQRYHDDKAQVFEALLAGMINGDQALAEYARLSRERYSDASRAMESLERNLAEFGKTRVEVGRMSVLESGNTAWIRRYDEAAAALARLEEQQEAAAKAAGAMADAQQRANEVMARGQATTRQFETPAQQFKRRILELREELAAGAIGFGTFIRASADAARSLRGPSIDNAARRGPVSAITAGGAEDIRLRLAAGSGRPEPQQEQVKEQKRGNRTLEAIKLEVIKSRIAAGAEVDL